MSHMGKSPITILGVNMGPHDSSAAILRDGTLIAMCEQERFSRNKRATGESPVDAIRFCLESAHVNLADVTAIGLGYDMKLLDRWHGLTPEELARREQLDGRERLFPKTVFEYDNLPPIISVRHHLAHAASAFWVSGFEEAAVLVVDNRGEDSSTTLAYGTRKGIKELVQYGVPVSLGLYYRTAAQYAGLCGELREVGKFMGLAAYGKPTEDVPLRCGEDGPWFAGLDALPSMRGINIPPYLTKQLLDHFCSRCFPFYKGDGSEVMAYANFAASVQLSLEETLLALCKKLKAQTGSGNLAMAGGVALNCTANGVITRSGIFENVFVQPAAGDAGVALGAALEVYRQVMNSPPPPFKMTHAYWGPEYSRDEVEYALRRCGLNYRVLEEDELVEEAAKLLTDYKTVGWFQGRSEIGPRALGARSILGNPMSRETLIRLNKIKSREMWRPLAPSVLQSRLSEFFSGTHASPFMIVASSVRSEKRSLIPAVVHVDGSARPQAVNQESNPLFWKLISAFERRTGIPMVVNTSFNTQREPLVNSPEDAINDYLKTDLDALIMGNTVVMKN